MKFIKFPVVFLSSLKGNELKIYAYLLSCQNRLGCVTVRQQVIRERCSIGSINTVQTALNGLVAKGAVLVSSRRNYDGDFIASRYDLTPVGGAWIPVEVSQRIFSLEKSEFSAYLYLLHQRRENGRAWPSYTIMAKALRMSRNTVIKAMRKLVDIGVVVKAKVRAGLHNLYTVLSSQDVPKDTHNSASNVLDIQPEVQENLPVFAIALMILTALLTVATMAMKRISSFFKWGSAIFGGQYIELSALTTKRKKVGVSQ